MIMLGLSLTGAYSIDVCAFFYSNCPNGCFVVLFCRFHRDFGSSDDDGDRDGTPCKPFASNCCLDHRSNVRIASMFMRYITQIALTVVLLWCFAGFARI